MMKKTMHITRPPLQNLNLSKVKEGREKVAKKCQAPSAQWFLLPCRHESWPLAARGSSLSLSLFLTCTPGRQTVIKLKSWARQWQRQGLRIEKREEKQRANE